ncbi:hypothetical protein FE782_28370 [Paenibacillus antri]|uniref:Oxygen sensor histidine kinase NreB n=1 Tax=Paenibacillus antri TaxID=2582848 RepID=A0A5R9G1N1_9BACL|nr:ATP-binding protein [Paenibacillus antri]TLS48919.1 hypothetical protein FE782_28370 [Paenibacillus antri]
MKAKGNGDSGYDPFRARLMSAAPFLLLRCGFAMLFILSCIVMTAEAWAKAEMLQTICGERSGTCVPFQLTSAEADRLVASGLSVPFYAYFSAVLDGVRYIGFLSIALLLFLKKSRDAMPMYASFTLAAAAPIFSLGYLEYTSQTFHVIENFVFIIGWILIMPFFYLYPSGRFVPKWTRILFVPWALIAIGMTYFPGSVLDPGSWPGWLDVPGIVFFHVSAIFAQLYRYRKHSDFQEKQQTQWFVFGAVLVLVGIPAMGLLEFIFESNPTGILFAQLGRSVIPLALPCAIAIGILRFRLWDIDILWRRTFIYAGMTIFIIATYALTAASISELLRVRDNFWSSLFAAALVGILFQPVREWVQRIVNRLFFGDREEPYAVLARLGKLLEGTFHQDDVLQVLCSTIREALKLPYAEVLLQQGDSFVTAASSGVHSPIEVKIPFYHGKQLLGFLQLAARSPGEGFSSKDRSLLEDLAGQAGKAIANVRLSEELKQSRTALVKSREEDRKRLKRDIHDGIGSNLAAFHMQTYNLMKSIRSDPDKAVRIAELLRQEIKSTIMEVRRIVYDLRPHALDELGLVAAIKAYASNLTFENDSLLITVDAPEPLPVLPAAVEVAVYRIASEALTNVQKHASADRCTVRIQVGEGVRLEVSDNGVGVPSTYVAGVGIFSMMERASEIGGTFEMSSKPGKGTRISVTVPTTGEINQ